MKNIFCVALFMAFTAAPTLHAADADEGSDRIANTYEMMYTKKKNQEAKAKAAGDDAGAKQYHDQAQKILDEYRSYQDNPGGKIGVGF